MPVQGTTPEETTYSTAQGTENAISVPAEYWQNKSHPATRDALREAGFPDFVIAYVLYEWIGPKNKTHIGSLLADKELKDAKSHRNLTNALLKQASYSAIIKA